jgi:hypothetical protein
MLWESAAGPLNLETLGWKTLIAEGQTQSVHLACI